MLDAKTASALKKIISSVNFRRRHISERESALKSNVLRNTTDSYEEDRLLSWSTNTFEPPELMKLYMVYQICSI